ncbi:Cu(I)-responsive transcriptional regulator [Aerophototrophica crusticola]|uniref:Cu(I)-responsive transcriptional regulator n=1 Tax=Aerophototrophica crusticola TaxID=1709002 RepID=A0A858R683_9PROT|nr:Cu(I)-responsive transcriptional regulator [Rhodospirillaceae bacterium B3]
MKIGTAAERSGVPAKTIRYYEEIGLIPSAGRAGNGYRDYDEQDVQALRFISRARSLGFSVKEVAGLLALWQDRDRSAAEVKRLAEAHLAEVDQRLADLQSLRRTLTDLVSQCHGGDRPDCPILDSLAASGGPCHATPDHQ